MNSLRNIISRNTWCGYLRDAARIQKCSRRLLNAPAIYPLSQSSTALKKENNFLNIVPALRQSSRKLHSSQLLQNHKDSVTITFIDRNGVRMKVEADIGETLLDIAKDHDIDGVEGACGGTLACSTCHCIFKQEDFDRLGFQDDITEEELDMLDLAYGLTDTSRLVCSIDVTEDMDGLEITVPTATNDARN